jgi:hypothetical protein
MAWMDADVEVSLHFSFDAYIVWFECVLSGVQQSDIHCTAAHNIHK